MKTAKHSYLVGTTAILILLTFRSFLAGSAPPVTQSVGSNGPPLVVRVDPRVELISLVFRLAGNPEYTQGRVSSYNDDADKHFDKFRDHEVVKLARQLRSSRGVSYDACMSLAVHLNNAQELSLVTPLNPWPEGLDRRWTAPDISRFLDAARAFVKDSAFPEFLNQHRSLYETTEERMKALMTQEGHLEWFQEFFGERPQATFTITPGLLNGGCCYGSRCRKPGGKESLYCILGVWKTDGKGLPLFTSDMLGTIVHEFGHSFANPMIDRHEAELRSAGETLFRPVASKMRSQAYSNGQTLLYELMVRACEVRYAVRYNGEAAGRRVIEYQKGRGFLWMEELSNQLAEYEAHRDNYPTFESFAPRLVTFFNEYASAFGKKQSAADKKKPKVVSMVPANGASAVDPSLAEIQVVFDQPMQDGSWALVGGGPHCPETTGKPSYDKSCKKWTVPVKLKPDWSYEFWLNSGSYDSFRSQDGTPLDSVKVTFKTSKATEGKQ
jgi:hypothetical protein